MRLETEAKLFVQDAIRQGRVDLVWSFVLDYENAENPFDEQRESIARWKELSVHDVCVNESIRAVAKDFVKLRGIGGKDALHLASALSVGCRFFLTTDRKFLKKSQGINEIETVSPIVFTAIMEGFV